MTAFAGDAYIMFFLPRSAFAHDKSSEGPDSQLAPGLPERADWNIRIAVWKFQVSAVRRPWNAINAASLRQF
jgi:hypothetical protein